jgi:hypothetical protein
MPAAGSKHKDRICAVEGCSGIGRHVAQRLVADGETVLDVPAKLSARPGVCYRPRRKTDPVDAHSVAVVAWRTTGLRQVIVDDTTVALRLLVDRRELLGRTRTETVGLLHHLLLELVPGAAKKLLSTQQARALLNTVRPRDVVGKTRRWLTSEPIHELSLIERNQDRQRGTDRSGRHHRQPSAGLQRHRPDRRRPPARRHRRHRPLQQPRAFCVLERHRTDRRLVR